MLGMEELLGLLRRRRRPVLPIAGEVAPDLRDRLAVPPLELGEHLRCRGDDEAGRGVLLVPAPDRVCERRIRRAVIAADRVPHLDHRVGIAFLGQLVHVFEDPIGRRLIERAHVEAVEPGVAPAGHPEQDPFAARRGEPIEGLVAPGLERPADPVAAVEQARHVVRPARYVLDAGQGQGRDEGP